jgi:hypothetical protein
MVKPRALCSYAVWSTSEEDDRLEVEVHSAVCQYSPHSCVGELLYGCRYIAAVMASSLACVRTVHERFAFTVS